MAVDREEDYISDIGCHFTWAELKRVDRTELEREYKALMRENLDFITIPTKTLSVTNLLGFIDYSLHDHMKAIGRFREVLTMDQSNVNALSCLAIIYRRQGLLTLYQECAFKLQRVLCTNNPAVLARAFADRALSVKQFQQDERLFTYTPYIVKAVQKSKLTDDRNEKAEWQYEYAIALGRKDAQHIMCNATPAQNEPVSCDAVKAFYKVIQLAKEDHPYVALAWANLGNILQRQADRSFERIIPSETALHGVVAEDCFNKALTMKPHSAEVFCLVGAAYMKLQRHKEALKLLHSSLQQQETHTAYRHCGLTYLQMWELQNGGDVTRVQKGCSNRMNSEDDFPLQQIDTTVRKRTDMSENGVSATNRIVDVDQHDDSETFIETLQAQMSNFGIDGQSSTATSNILTKSTSGSFEVSDTKPSYVKVDHAFEIKDGLDTNFESEVKASSDEKTLLLKAREAFTKAIRLKPVHSDHSDLGYVLHLLGEDLHQSIQHYSIAIKCPEGDSFDTSQTHGRWAECLEALGEHQGMHIQRNLERQIKISMQQQTSTQEERYTHGVNCQGYECEISRFNYCAEERPGYINILSEYKTPVSSPVRFFTNYLGEFKYSFFVSFAHIDYKWSVAFVHKLEKDFPGVRGRLRYRDYELGAAIADNIVNSVENSYRTLIIMTPDSLRDQWCRYEVQRAHMMNLTRSCAIPIMLRPCRIPKEIEHLSVVKCDQGQIKAEDWDRLGRSLRQSEHHDEEY